jgi:hypothetical protein
MWDPISLITLIWFNKLILILNKNKVIYQLRV